MAHVVMQAAQFSTVAGARRAEQARRTLVDAYIEFEEEDPSPVLQNA